MSRNRNNQRPLSSEQVLDDLQVWAKGSVMVSVFAGSIALMVFGANNFAEDIYSSYVGIQLLESYYRIQMASWPFTYWSMSALPQAMQATMMFLVASGRRGWIIWALFGFFFLQDFIPDMYHRSMQEFCWTATGYCLGRWVATTIEVLGYFTVGSEFAISLGLSVFFLTVVDAIGTMKEAIAGTWRVIFGGGKKQTTNQNQNRNNNRNNNRDRRPNHPAPRPNRPPVAQPHNNQPQNGRDPQYSEASMEYFFHLDDK